MERDNYKKFLEELLFIYNEDHPQQALRRRIQAAIDKRWEDALLMNTCYSGEYNDSNTETSRESKHTLLLPDDTPPTSEGPPPFD